MPVDGPDNRFGQIHTPIKKNPYKNAGLKGYTPAQPYKAAPANPAIPAEDDIRFPTLAELNSECFQWDEGEEDLILADPSLCQEIEVLQLQDLKLRLLRSLPPPLHLQLKLHLHPESQRLGP